MSSKGFLPTIEQKKICLQCMQPRLNPWVKQVSWRREWPTAGFLPENFHAQRSLMGYSSQGQKTFEVPVHYCSLLCWTLLSPPDTSTAEHRFCFGQPLKSFWSYFIALYSSPVAYWTPSNPGSSSFISYLFVFSYCLWGSPGKNTGVVCYFLLQWTIRQYSSLSSIILRGPAWHGSQLY